jgi:hypothetical protein
MSLPKQESKGPAKGAEDAITTTTTTNRKMLPDIRVFAADSPEAQEILALVLGDIKYKGLQGGLTNAYHFNWILVTYSALHEMFDSPRTTYPLDMSLKSAARLAALQAFRSDAYDCLVSTWKSAVNDDFGHGDVLYKTTVELQVSVCYCDGDKEQRALTFMVHQHRKKRTGTAEGNT